MGTKIFSSRADEGALAYADSLTRKQFGISYGQYCGSILIDAICQGAELPQPTSDDEKTKKQSAVLKLKELAGKTGDARIGSLSDDEMKDLIAIRYVQDD